MQNNVGAPQSDDSCFIEFEDYDAQPARWGFNPRSREYEKTVKRRRTISAILFAAIAILIASLWFLGRVSSWLALPFLLVASLLVAAVEWSWRNSRFCNHCGARTKGPREKEAFVWCPVCHGLTDPARVTLEPVGQFDVGSMDYLGHIDPVYRFLDIVILMAIKDHAQVARFEPLHDAYEIHFEIQGESYELMPPPSWLHFPVAQAVKAIAGLDLPTCDRRQEGHIDAMCGGHPVPIDVAVEPAEFGQKITLRLLGEYWVPRAATPLAGQAS